ncbi:ATP-binding protein [Polaromonas naphthalenivorans]|uniref:Uncharacterized protein n=1 Tax=Polaromonas naphthalenivorans (strain CJ2) TaxID=365044 RepID=A1VWF7_POLNA|nr:hypothetical protein [Polaromonas naphthalenivorans]ABM39985.1 conserved hypothetical protein [Polaromonas naphthalenivorans CJ2]
MTKPTLAPDPWHFPRPELAQKYLLSFGLGLSSARGLFAKRRMGKSEFLEQDLIPAAQAEGYLTAYLNMWDARTHPTPSLVAALSRAVEPKGLSKLVQRLNAPLKKVKASGKLPGLVEGSLEAELVDGPAIAGPLLSELLRGFDKPGKRLLLVLDEAQVLADPLHTELAHSLRAGLDSRKQNIKVVFAGSSEPTLRRMFGRSTEPFYNWAPLEPFELLDAEFVKAMVAKVNNLSRFPLAEKDAMAAFETLKKTPEFFRRYLNRYLTYAELGPQAALEDTQAHVFSGANFKDLWNKLLPADREVLKLLVKGVTDLYSEANRLRLGLSLGLDKAVSKNTPQNSLRRLQDEGLVARFDHGEYQVQDDAMAEWLRNLELDI